MEAIGKGILAFMLLVKSLSPSVGHRTPGATSYVPDPRRPPILRIAVMPFENVSADTNAGDRLMEPLITYLLHTQVIGVVDPSLVDQQLFEMKVRKPSQITTKMSRDIKKALGVDAILTGKITAYQVDSAGGDSVPTIAVSARLLDLETLGIIWSASIVRGGSDKSILFDIGRIDKLSDLTQLVAQDLASALGKQAKGALKGYAEKSGVSRVLAQQGLLTPPMLTAPAQGAAGAVSLSGTAPRSPETRETPDASSAPSGTDESTASDQPPKNLPDFFPDVEGYKRGDVATGAHAAPVAENTYVKSGLPITVRVVDCGNQTTCKALQSATASGPLEPGPQINGDECLKSKGPMGLTTLTIVHGRYLLEVSGGGASMEDMRALAYEILKQMGK